MVLSSRKTLDECPLPDAFYAIDIPLLQVSSGFVVAAGKTNGEIVAHPSLKRRLTEKSLVPKRSKYLYVIDDDAMALTMRRRIGKCGTYHQGGLVGR